ncbi:MAG: SDR family NAD(P)-dependent oxidoreductase [Rhodobacteraceae bacterium]|nr:MAG: SDR family NAD(P)-dependent oxidoreductase [Paracoccaceae bacterium]
MSAVRKVALVSGANRGIGAAVAARLAADGWALSLGARSGAVDAVAPGPTVHVRAYDATAEGSEAAWVAEALDRFGRIDAVVANAGLLIAKDVVAAEDADLDAMLDVNVKAPRRLIKAAWPALTAHGHGRVVVVASLSGKRVKSAKSGLYAMTKHAALALAHAVRHAGWAQGVRATAVCPGFVATDMARGLSAMPPSAMTRPEDVARLVALALDLPNEASVAELAVNCQAEDSF